MAKYMHTISGAPAFFDGEQICFARRGASLQGILVDSLKQIRQEQSASNHFRKVILKAGWEPGVYGYLWFKP